VTVSPITIARGRVSPAGDHANKVVCRPIRTDQHDDASGGSANVYLTNKFCAVRLADSSASITTSPDAARVESESPNLAPLIRLLVEQRLVSINARLALGVRALGDMRIHSSSRCRSLPFTFRLLFAAQSLLFLFQPGTCNFLSREFRASIKFQNPTATLSRKYLSWVTAMIVSG